MDVQAQFVASPTPTVASYTITWTLNGSTVGTLSLPTVAPLTTLFSAANPSVTLGAGNLVGASIVAVDQNGLSSTPLVLEPITLAAPPPPPPPPPVAPQPPASGSLTQV
jgi:hypothetical protein